MRKSIFSLLILLVFHSNNSCFCCWRQRNTKRRCSVDGQNLSFLYRIRGLPLFGRRLAQQVDIALQNGKVATNVKCRFNIVSNDLLFYNESLKRVFIAEKDFVTSFTIDAGNADSLFFFKYNGSDVGYRLKNDDFVHSLYKRKINFFVKHLCRHYSC